MLRKTIKQILIDRDNISSEQADDLISEVREAMYEYLSLGGEDLAYDICMEYFGLEPDYLDELI